MTDEAPVSLALNIENDSLRIAGACTSEMPTQSNDAASFDNSQASGDVGSMMKTAA